MSNPIRVLVRAVRNSRVEVFERDLEIELLAELVAYFEDHVGPVLSVVAVATGARLFKSSFEAWDLGVQQ